MVTHAMAVPVSQTSAIAIRLLSQISNMDVGRANTLKQGGAGFSEATAYVCRHQLLSH